MAEPSNNEKLARKTTLGILWTTGQSFAARAISLVGNLVMAWFLTREDFGVFGMAATIAAFCEVFGAGGIGTVLIVRKSSFHLWSMPAAWLSASFGVLVAGLMIACAWIGAVVFEFERAGELLVLVSVMALGTIVNSLAVVPTARLRIDMRFGALALVETTQLSISSIGKILMAFFGFGALSFVVPNVVTGFARTATLWSIAGTAIKRKLYFRRWKFLLKDTSLLMLTALLFKVITYGDYAILAFYVSQSEMGLYFFAFSYSVMGVILLTAGLVSVLVPAFSNMKDAQQQFSGFVRSARVLLAVVCPLCLLQAAVSEPGVLLFLKSEWEPAIPLLQILSLGMAGRTISWVAASLMEAQGRFRTRMILGFVSAVVFIVFAVIGVEAGGIIGMAIAVAVFYPLMSVCNTYVAISKYPNPSHTLLRICLKPVVSTSVAVVSGWLISKAVTHTEATELITTALLSSVFYLLLLRTWMFEEWDEIQRLLQRFVPNSMRASLSGWLIPRTTDEKKH